MKIAISGKGGVGKSTIAAAAARYLSAQGHSVLALDADPDANLASALGIPNSEQQSITPISKQVGLIEERTNTSNGEYGKLFKLNPDVSDIAEKLGYTRNGISLIVLGAVQNGGGGCACPESTFIKTLVTDLVLYKKQSLIMDMEAGVEHLGRSTAMGVDAMLIVMEPGKRSIDCAQSVLRLGGEIGIKKYLLIGNKITSKADEDYLTSAFPDRTFTAMIPYSEKIRTADRDGVSVYDILDSELTPYFENLFNALNA